MIGFQKLISIDLSKNPSFNSVYFKKILKIINVLVNILANLNKERNLEKSNFNSLNKLNSFKYFYTKNIINEEILNEILSLLDIDHKTTTAFIMKFLREIIKNYLRNILEFNLIDELEKFIRIFLNKNSILLICLQDEKIICTLIKTYLKFILNYNEKTKVFSKNYDFKLEYEFIFLFKTIIKAAFCYMNIKGIKLDMLHKIILILPNNKKENEKDKFLIKDKIVNNDNEENDNNNNYNLNIEEFIKEKLNFDEKLFKFFKENKKLYINKNIIKEQILREEMKEMYVNKENKNLKEEIYFKQFKNIINLSHFEDYIQIFFDMKTLLNNLNSDNYKNSSSINRMAIEGLDKILYYLTNKYISNNNIIKEINNIKYGKTDIEKICFNQKKYSITVLTKYFNFITNPNTNIMDFFNYNLSNNINVKRIDNKIFLFNIKEIFKHFNHDESQKKIASEIKNKFDIILKYNNYNNIDLIFDNNKKSLFFIAEENAKFSIKEKEINIYLFNINKQFKKFLINYNIKEKFIKDIIVQNEINKHSDSKLNLLLKKIKENIKNEVKLYNDYTNQHFDSSYINNKEIYKNIILLNCEYQNINKIRFNKIITEKLIYLLFQHYYFLEKYLDLDNLNEKNNKFTVGNQINFKCSIENIQSALEELIKLYFKHFLNFKLKKTDEIEISRIKIPKNTNKSLDSNLLSIFKIKDIFVFLLIYKNCFSFNILPNKGFLQKIYSKIDKFKNYYKISFNQECIISKKISQECFLEKSIFELKNLIKSTNEIKPSENYKLWSTNRILVELKLIKVFHDLQNS